MKRLLLVLLLLATPVCAQVITSSVQTVPGAVGPIGFDAKSSAYVAQHLLTVGPAPVISSCGGQTAPTANSTDFAGSVVVGGTLTTSCIITFAVPYGAAPVCIVSWASGPLAAMSYTTSTTAITVTQTSTASDTINYICTGKQ